MNVDDEITVIYFLENYELRQVELESVVECDGRTEITYKALWTDEGGNLISEPH
jgi:hypothetical protein